MKVEHLEGQPQHCRGHHQKLMVFLTFIKGLHERFDDLRFPVPPYPRDIMHSFFSGFCKVAWLAMIRNALSCSLFKRKSVMIRSMIPLSCARTALNICRYTSPPTTSTMFGLKHAIVTLVANSRAVAMADSLLEVFVVLRAQRLSTIFWVVRFWLYRLERVPKSGNPSWLGSSTLTRSMCALLCHRLSSTFCSFAENSNSSSQWLVPFVGIKIHTAVGLCKCMYPMHRARPNSPMIFNFILTLFVVFSGVIIACIQAFISCVEVFHNFPLSFAESYATKLLSQVSIRLSIFSCSHTAWKNVNIVQHNIHDLPCLLGVKYLEEVGHYESIFPFQASPVVAVWDVSWVERTIFFRCWFWRLIHNIQLIVVVIFFWHLRRLQNPQYRSSMKSLQRRIPTIVSTLLLCLVWAMLVNLLAGPMFSSLSVLQILDHLQHLRPSWSFSLHLVVFSYKRIQSYNVIESYIFGRKYVIIDLGQTDDLPVVHDQLFGNVALVRKIAWIDFLGQEFFTSFTYDLQ